VTRRAAAVLLAAIALLAGGCRDTANSTSTGGDTVTAYSLLPLQGSTRIAARDLVDGEKLALTQAHGQVGPLTVNFRSVDSSEAGRVTPPSAARAARTVAQDTTAIAAIGTLEAREAAVAVPLLNEASVGLLSPNVTAPAIDSPQLYPSGQPTFSRLVGDDDSQARALVAGARSRGCGHLEILVGGRTDRPFAARVARAAGGGHATVRSLDTAGSVRAGACAVLAVSNAFRAGLATRALPSPRVVLAPYALASPSFARTAGAAARSVSALVPQPRAGAGVAAAYRRSFSRPASRDGLLGYDAMQTVLAAVRQAGKHGNDRAAVARALQRVRPLSWAFAQVQR